MRMDGRNMFFFLGLIDRSGIESEAISEEFLKLAGLDFVGETSLFSIGTPLVLNREIIY